LNHEHGAFVWIKPDEALADARAPAEPALKPPVPSDSYDAEDTAARFQRLREERREAGGPDGVNRAISSPAPTLMPDLPSADASGDDDDAVLVKLMSALDKLDQRLSAAEGAVRTG
jgi:hypothetical protein